jgi:cysteine desulfurase
MKSFANFFKKRIYADAAAATPVSSAAQKELVRLLRLYGNPGALHKEAVAAKQELERARENIARVLGAHADEIIFTSGGTEANNLAILGALRGPLHERGELNAITSAIEHSSVLEPLRALSDEGLYVTELGVDTAGKVNPKDLREAISDETALVSIQMVNSEIGTIQDIRKIAKEIRHARKGRTNALPLYLHVDASQAPLWLALNVEKLGVDLLTIDAQKILGPQGAGALFARRGVALVPLIYGGGQERGVRSGTENVAFAGALSVALAEAQQNAQDRAERISKVRDFLISEIKKLIPEAELNGAEGVQRVANNINMHIPHLSGDMAVIALDAEGVAASTRSACDTEDEVVSHVLQAIGAGAQRAKNSIRITLLPAAAAGEARQIARILLEVTKRYSQKG